MSNPEHVEILSQGVEVWNQWRKSSFGVVPDLAEADLIEVDLSGVDWHGADLRRANLIGSNLVGSNLIAASLCNTKLRGARLRKAKLYQTDLHGANLSGSQLSCTNLVEADLTKAELEGANLIGANLSRANLREANLIGANLSRANLREVDLVDSKLRGAKLIGANLSGADLTRAEVLMVNFSSAVLTAACLKDWNAKSWTVFDDVLCRYIYLEPFQQERRPREGVFKPGEFAALFQQALDTLDLIFVDGIDWQAFFQSFQDLRSQYADQDLSIQAIERKRGGAFVVRLEVPPEADKAVVEEKAKTLYGEQLKQIEGRYQELLQLQGQQLYDYRSQVQKHQQQNSRLLGIVETMAEKESASKYDLRGAQFAGGFAETVQGDQIGGNITNQSAEAPSLAEAAAEIQNLLKQLEDSNPQATEAEQASYLNIMIPPTRRQRFVGALQSASSAALDEIPYGPILKALVDGWKNPNG